MPRRFVSLLIALLVTALAAASGAAGGASPIRAQANQAACEFVLGFATLRDLIGSDTVGTCLENQRFADNGNAEQRTSQGLLVWRKADNWTAFTDGNRTWINGPNGLQTRLNTERFSWEPDAAGFPAPAAADPGSPVLAWYYPQFSQGLDADFANAADAHIDALVVSETGMSDLVPFLAAARAHGVHAALGVEQQQYGSADAMVDRLSKVLAAFGTDPGYLRYQGKPVLVFWNLPSVPRYAGQSAQQTWAIIRSRVDPGRDSIWIGEGGDPGTTLTYMPAFDGLHLYSIAWAADPGAALASWAGRLRNYDAGKLWVATVMPGGYYGSGSDPSQWQYRDRQSGAYYRATWRGAIATAPAMVIVTSYNETRERTDIHPTAEWGTLYLDITRDMATAWHG
jgi:hypothetical protein